MEVAAVEDVPIAHVGTGACVDVGIDLGLWPAVGVDAAGEDAGGAWAVAVRTAPNDA